LDADLVEDEGTLTDTIARSAKEYVHPLVPSASVPSISPTSNYSFAGPDQPSTALQVVSLDPMQTPTKGIFATSRPSFYRSGLEQLSPVRLMKLVLSSAVLPIHMIVKQSFVS
jgi:hypothetical protein